MKKNAIITGASSELGINIALSLEENYNLILIKNNNEIDLNQFSSNADIIKCDLNNLIEVNKIIELIKNKYDNIDLIINAAARSIDNELSNITSDEFLKTLNVNVVTPFILIQKLMNNGIVINISSTDGIDTYNEYNLTYATSKAALNHLTKQLAYANPNLKIYGLALNYINTKTTKEMEPNFLKQELKRVNQDKLIEINDIIEKIKYILNELPKNGTIIRMD